MIQSCGSGNKLAALIKKAIEDHELTDSEYMQILATADEDGIIDAQERALLAQLQELLSDGSVKKVPG